MKREKGRRNGSTEASLPAAKIGYSETSRSSPTLAEQ